jgi:hypothetical protein
VSPLSPLGIVKLNIAAPLVPEFVTDAEDPAAPVVVDPIVTVAAVPVKPWLPVGPVAPDPVVLKVWAEIIHLMSLSSASRVLMIPIKSFS